MAGKEYRLTILVSGRDSGAKSMLGGIGSALGSIGTIAGSILSAGFFIAIANQVKEFAIEAISATANVQRMGMMLQTLQARELLKSGDFVDMNKALEAAGPLAKRTMDELTRIAIISPYQLQSVQDTYRMAMAFGYTSNEATMFTKAILNMGAGVGAGSEQLDRMSYNLAQIRMVGKVTALDIRQLAMAGLDLNDVLKYVGKQMGVNIKDHLDFNKAIQTGKITWADFTKYFAQYADKNFGGAAERMSRTLYGLQSTFKDVFALSMPAILGPAAEQVTVLLNDILNSFMGLRDSGALEVLGQNLADDLKPGIDAVRKFFEDIGVLTSNFENERGWENVAKKFDLSQQLLNSSEAFKKWSQSIDWAGMSDNIIAGIDQIDWPGIGIKVENFSSDIFSGVANAVTKIDWIGISASLTIGMSSAIASAATGQQITFQSTLANYQSFGDGVRTAIQGWQAKTEEGILAWVFSTQTKLREWQGQVATSIWNAISGVIPSIVTAIWLWNTPIDTSLRTIAATFYDRAAGWVQQAISAVLGLGPTLIANIVKLMDQIKGSIKPVSFSISLPNFEQLAAAAAAGFAMVQAALSGHGTVGGKPKSGGGGGATVVPIPKPVQGAANGGVFSGSTSGYPMTLHGTEAVIPLQNGAVPVSIQASGMGGGVNINLSFVYSPMISTADRHEAEGLIAPMLVERIRQEFSKRNL